MTKRPLKLLPVWLAISAVIIVAGIILMSLLGFNTAPERAKSYSFEVRYDVSVEIDPQKVSALEGICEQQFEAHNVSAAARQDGNDVTYNMTVITYVFSGDTSADALKLAKKGIDDAIKANAGLSEALISVDYYELSNVGGFAYDATWRGALGLTVGAIVALVYIGIRFGVGNAVTGLVLCAHDVAFTLSFLAIARIPTYTFAPLLFAAIAAVFSVVFWLIHCAQLRDAKKDAALRNLPSADAVSYAWENSWKKILIIAAAGIAMFAVAGGLAAAGVRLALLPAMISVAVAAYSSVLLGPALHIHIKGAFDKFFAKHKRYSGKKKAENRAAPEASEN